MLSNSALNMNSNNNLYNNDKIEFTDEKNQILLKDLKISIDELEKEKFETEKRVKELKEKLIDLNISTNQEKLISLEKERDELKLKATNSLSLCSKMAEELIILRDKLDKHNYLNQKL